MPTFWSIYGQVTEEQYNLLPPDKRLPIAQDPVPGVASNDESLVIGDLLTGSPGAGSLPVGPPAQPPPPPAAPAAPPRDVSSGKAVVKNVLRSAGLEMTPELEQYAIDLATNTANDNDLANRITADIYDAGSVPGKLVAAKYPAIFSRIKAGKAPITVGDYIGLKQQFTQDVAGAGLSPYIGDLDGQIDKWISDDTSPAEIKDRIGAAQTAVFNEPADVRGELQRLFGVGDSLGAATAYYLDPSRSVPTIQKQLTAARLGGAAQRSGFGLLTQDEALGLAAQGVTADEAQSGFGTLAGSRELFGVLPGEVGGPISRGTQIAAAFSDDAAAQEEISRKARARRAVFGGSGGWGQGRAGVAGLGTAAS